MKDIGRTLRLVSLLLVVWLAISSASVLVVLSGASPEACAFWRLSFSIPLIYFLGVILEKSKPVITRLKIHNIIAGLALSLHFILWMNSLFLIPIFISTLLVTLYPIYSFLIEAFVFKRRINGFQLIGLITSTILLSLYLGVHELVFNTGVIEALIAGFLASIYFVAGHYARMYLKEPLVDYTVKTYSIASLFTLIFALIHGSVIVYGDISTYIYFALLAVVPMILGHTLMNYLVGKYPSSVITMVSYGEPFGAGLLAYLILGQELAPGHIFYGSLIVICVFVTVTLSTRTRG